MHDNLLPRMSTRWRTPAWTAAVVGVLSLFAAVLTAAPAGATVNGSNVHYTTDADFDAGNLQDVNLDAPNNNQLQLDKVQTFFPYVNIAASALGTMLRIDVIGRHRRRVVVGARRARTKPVTHHCGQARKHMAV